MDKFNIVMKKFNFIERFWRERFESIGDLGFGEDRGDKIILPELLLTESEKRDNSVYVIRKTKYGETAFTKKGSPIGDVKMAKLLVDKMGIIPQKADPNHSICSIGFNKEKQKWYGWSHRAIYGFGIGDKVKKGHCGYVPSTQDEFIENEIRFWKDLHNVTVEKRTNDGVWFKYEPKKKDRSGINRKPEFIKFQLGRGEWEAKTLEDAKEMAKDFARGVS